MNTARYPTKKMIGRVPATVVVASRTADVRNQSARRRGPSRNSGCCGAAACRPMPVRSDQRSSGYGVVMPIQIPPRRSRNPPETDTTIAVAANRTQTTSSTRAHRGSGADCDGCVSAMFGIGNPSGLLSPLICRNCGHSRIAEAVARQRPTRDIRFFGRAKRSHDDLIPRSAGDAAR